MPKPKPTDTTFATFATRLRVLRERASLTISQLADAASMSRQAIHKLERGEREPTLETAKQLAKALGVSLAEFDA